MTIGELREWVLDHKTTDDDLVRASRGFTGEVAAGVAKLMSIMDLVYGASKIHHITRCNTTIGQPGVLTFRNQPNSPTDNPEASLVEIQTPIVEAYEAALGDGGQRRLLASRTVVVVDEENRTRVLEAALPSLRRFAGGFGGRDLTGLNPEEILLATDSVFGTPDEVIDQLRRDTVAASATEVAFQVHSLEPGHEITLRSLELLATEVAPALGWGA